MLQSNGLNIHVRTNSTYVTADLTPEVTHTYPRFPQKWCQTVL